MGTLRADAAASSGLRRKYMVLHASLRERAVEGGKILLSFGALLVF